MRAVALLLMVSLTAAAECKKGKPNIVFFLTDDQDQMLGGSFPPHNGITPLPKTNSQLAEKGATATNFFIHTPICCPSRAETVTGRYFHNVKTTGKCLTGYSGGPGDKGECCFHVDNNKVVNNTFAKTMKDNGYTIGLFGKYLNQWPRDGLNAAGAKSPGFDAWMANGGGTYYAPSFATEGISDLGAAGKPDGGWHGGEDDYTTAIVGNTSLAWIKKVAPLDKPFFAYIAPKACHEEFAPAQWYKDHWDASWPATEPRPASWNASFESRADHHHAIAVAPLITPLAARQITMVFKDRWRVLMSVDDVIDTVVTEIDNQGLIDCTYFFYSSDHGFQLGEFNMPFDKRHVYDFDTRIHLLVRGPGVKAGSTFAHLATNVDFAPTWLGLAGIDAPADMDGKSMVPLLVDSADPSVLPATRQHLSSLKAKEEYTATWRDCVFIEYYYVQLNTKCLPYTPLDPVTGKGCKDGDAGCTCTNIEDPSNNFIALRHRDGEFGDTLYAEFQESPNSDVFFDNLTFHEYYDMGADPWSINNLYNTGNHTALSALHTKLHKWFKCQGKECP